MHIVVEVACNYPDRRDPCPDIFMPVCCAPHSSGTIQFLYKIIILSLRLSALQELHTKGLLERRDPAAAEALLAVLRGIDPGRNPGPAWRPGEFRSSNRGWGPCAGRGEWEFSELVQLVVAAAAALASVPVPGPIREELHALCLGIAAEARRWPLRGADSLAGAFSPLHAPMTAAPAADAFVVLAAALATAPAGGSAAPSAADGGPAAMDAIVSISLCGAAVEGTAEHYHKASSTAVTDGVCRAEKRSAAAMMGIAL